MGALFLSEVVGTAMLLLLGAGVVANTALTKSKGNGTGFLFVNFGWGLAVFAGVLVSQASGAHINPAVTLGLAAQSIAKGEAVDWAKVGVYLIAQLIGAFIGAVLAWVAYKQHFDEEPDPATKLGVFSTGPAIRNYGWNLATEAIGTFVLVFVIIAAGSWKSVDLGWLSALGVALLVVGIGASLGGPTGYAINPARDLGPRIAHAVLPIKGKGDSDWSYSWVPVVGPIIGGVLAGLLAGYLLPVM
ncbi:MIP/aquaporin family protein [Propionicimonas sp.]|uniref:MIP/aquaporin family protein n=1 Tax=Propionicimonas sp. TaxID=1955623 RepID=UPI00184909F4|nr:MIP/aquaporin family protein [Propionicimonas sp.]MBU3976362.1 aquaporin family protein [Actinomycetota bacterium]MBA3022045.1 aquaporin family protein [Propionicimonas sp.]MBU3987519.1 aquaporin family protein [Actinomycetota bacterium]MBU4006536.1 aquaporin family protein [Actinomycetota bacterium]MBU4065141.1 aquaporin family protein [Actinomycetota bacterium]